MCSPKHVDFDWIFFDCFNTLIDDFDNAAFGFKKPDSRIFYQALSLARLDSENMGKSPFHRRPARARYLPGQSFRDADASFQPLQIPTSYDVAAIYDWRDFDESAYSSAQ